MKRRLFSCLGVVLAAFCLLSPCHADEVQPVAMICLIKDGTDKELAKTLVELDQSKMSLRLRWLNFYTEKLGDKRVLLCTFDLDKGVHAEEVWKAFQEDVALKSWWTKLSTSLVAHPRAAAQGGLWARCETICALQSYVAPELRGDIQKSIPRWHAGVTGLKKEKEAEYRLLHNQVWPGVVDAIGNAGIERFDVFLIELGDQLYLFDHFLFVGKDFASDTARMAKNPVNQRWWAITDPCQQPLPSAAARKEIWEPMEAAVELAK